MYRKPILILLLCSAGMLLILVCLYAVSPLTKEMYRGGFERNLAKPGFIVSSKILKLPYNSYYIVGVGNNTVYLGNWTNAFHMIVLDMESLDSQHVYLKIKDTTKFKDFQNFKLKIDSPYFYLTNGFMPAVYRGEIEAGTATPFIEGGDYFMDIEPIGKSAMVIKSYNTKSESLELGRKTRDGKTDFKYDIINKQADGIFSIDGMINVDQKNNTVVYTHKHINEYIVMDTNLNVKYRSHTLDTFKVASLKVADIESDNSKMLTGLPKYINTLTSINKNRLFVRSNILAKNENLKSFVEGATIDVFDINQNKYMYSFNLYNHGNNPLSDFEVSNNKIITMYGDYILIQTMNRNITH